VIAECGSGRVLARAATVAALAVVALLAPVGVAPVLAAADALSLVSTSSYTLVPDQGLVHVTVDITATNNKPNKVQETSSGTLTTRYFYDAAAIVVHAEATGVRASVGKVTLVTKVTPEDGYAVVQVSFLKDLHYKESTAFRVDYDLPGGPPRSASEIRVGSAFATFYVWAFGDRGDVSIVIPAGFEVDTTGSALAESVTDGVTNLTATEVTDPNEWFAVVVADRHDALTQDRLELAGDENVIVRAWPEDVEWRTRVRDLLRLGLPILVEKIGLDWPVDGEMEVAEVHTPLLEGYAGVFYTDEDRIEISEDLDELTIIHEASHAWFNPNLFVGRWINEGFADEYAARVLDEVSVGGLRPDAVSPSSEGAVELNLWEHPGRIDDEETDQREHYGYEASWTVIRTLLDEIGEESMRKVLAAADASHTAYVGAGDPETVTIKNDWRRFLDLLEEAGGSDRAEEEFRHWVVAPEQEQQLDSRRQAREAYAALLDAGAGWRPGYVVRDPMGRWEFARATGEIAAATEILATRDRVAALSAELGVAPPGSLRVAYEEAADSLDAARELANDHLATAMALDAAADRVAAERDVFTSLGLIGEDPAGGLTGATAAFSTGDSDAASSGAAAVGSLVTGAADVGRTRALAGGLAGASVLALGAGGAYAMHRRRQSRVLGPALVNVRSLDEQAVAPAFASPDAPQDSSSVSPPNPPDSYATLGDPRQAEPDADAPAPPGDAQGDDR
jgi:hypothetical protein